MLVLATCLPATGTLNVEQTSEDEYTHENFRGITPFYPNEHYVGIRIPNLNMSYDSDDGTLGSGEFIFKCYAFPRLWSNTSIVYHMSDDVTVPHHLSTIAHFDTRFTPQFILILCIEQDDADRDDFCGYKFLRFNPPKGDYKWPNQTEIMYTWENYFFKAEIIVFMHYGNPGSNR